MRDTLDAIVSPGVREAILRDSVRQSGLSGLPTGRPALASFVLGPFRTVVEAAVGSALAGTIVEEILRGVARAPASTMPPPLKRKSSEPKSQQPLKSLTPPRWRASGGVPSFKAGPPSTTRPAVAQRNTEPATLEAAETRGQPMAPLILVATAEGLLFETLAEWFDHRAFVERVTSADTIASRIASERDRRVLVIVDGKRPSVTPGALAELLEPLRRVRVVLCRAAPALAEAVLTTLPSGADWFVYREPASLDHVAAECLRLVS